MVIRKVVLTHVRIPLVEPFRISSGVVAEKDAIVVRIEAEDLVGYGESSPMSGSFYSSDTPESCWLELCDTLVPRLLAEPFAAPLDAVDWLNPQAGSKFAKVGVETALWDIEARMQGKPLGELLGGDQKPVESGLAVGLYEHTSDLLHAIERYRPGGYKRVKIKIERGRDVDLVRAVRGAFGDIPLFVDANGAYDLSDVSVFRQLDEFNLMMFEQPFPARMFSETAQLQAMVRTPVCLDESLETLEDLEQAIALGSLKIANIKIQRVGGFFNALALYNACLRNNIPVWVGTMPELGVGQAQALAFGTLPGCVFPTDVEASSRWFRDDIIEPWIEVHEGYLKPSPSEGLGFAIATDKLSRYAVAERSFGVTK